MPTESRNLRSAPPVAEGLEERFLRGRVELIGNEPAGERDRDPDLLEVTGAAVALRDVRLEARSVRCRQRIVEVCRDELDKLLAAQLIGDLGHTSSMKYSSSAARTFARARCRSTLSFVSESSSVL